MLQISTSYIDNWLGYDIMYLYYKGYRSVGRKQFMRYEKRVNLTKSLNEYFKFLNGKYNYLVTSKCYWLNNEYDTNSAFALTKIDSTNSKIYGEVKTSTCSIVPVIIASKTNIDI